MSEDFKWKYSEGAILDELRAYLRKTYGEHYAGENGVQAFDVFEGLGSLDTFARDNAIKYLMRYGKKDGKNRKDLLKILHYAVILLHTHDKEAKQKAEDSLKENPYEFSTNSYFIPTIIRPFSEPHPFDYRPLRYYEEEEWKRPADWTAETTDAAGKIKPEGSTS